MSDGVKIIEHSYITGYSKNGLADPSGLQFDNMADAKAPESKPEAQLARRGSDLECRVKIN